MIKARIVRKEHVRGSGSKKYYQTKVVQILLNVGIIPFHNVTKIEVNSGNIFIVKWCCFASNTAA